MFIPSRRRRIVTFVMAGITAFSLISGARAVDPGSISPGPAGGTPAPIPATDVTVPPADASLRQIIESLLIKDPVSQNLTPFGTIRTGEAPKFNDQDFALWNNARFAGPAIQQAGPQAALRWDDYSGLGSVYSGFSSGNDVAYQNRLLAHWSDGTPHLADGGPVNAQLIDAVYNPAINQLRATSTIAGGGSLATAQLALLGGTGGNIGGLVGATVLDGSAAVFNGGGDIRQVVANGFNTPTPAAMNGGMAPMTSPATPTSPPVTPTPPPVTPPPPPVVPPPPPVIPNLSFGDTFTTSQSQLLFNVNGSPSVNVFFGSAGGSTAGPFPVPQTNLSFNLGTGTNNVGFINFGTLPGTVSGSALDPSNNPLFNFSGGIGPSDSNVININRP